MKAALELGHIFLSDELLLRLAVLMASAALALRVLGMRRLAGVLLGSAVSIVVVSFVLAPLAGDLVMLVPPWVAVALLVAFGFYVLRTLGAMFLGKGAVDQVLGILVAGLISILLIRSFRLIGRTFALAIKALLHTAKSPTARRLLAWTALATASVGFGYWVGGILVA